jgi:transcription-repair coupling factor (superfamily II helicase)
MQLQTIFDHLLPEFKRVGALLESEQGPLALGLRRSARLVGLAAIYLLQPRPLLFITERADHTLALFDELKLWLPQASRFLFPEPTPLFYENAPWANTTRQERLGILTNLGIHHIPGAMINPRDAFPIILAPARAVMARTMPRRDFLKNTRQYKMEQVIQPEELTRTWVKIGYEHVNTVLTSGQFARRGGILDIWPSAAHQPTRIEFFGDEIETLRYFDPATQRTTAVQERILVAPAREYILDPNREINGEVSEFHLPLLHPEPACLIDYLPRQTLVLVEDLQTLQETVADLEEQAIQMRNEAIHDANLAQDFPTPYLSWSELFDILQNHKRLELGGQAEENQSEAKITLGLPGFSERFSTGTRFGGRLKTFIEELVQHVNEGGKAYIVSRQASRLAELWSEHKHLLKAGAASANFLEGSLAEGWKYTPLDGPRLHLYTDGEIFGWRRPEIRQRPRSLSVSPESAYADLQPGDYVVHVDHGIGVFIGMVTRTLENIEREYLCVEYADQAQLFVPVHQADRVTRYVGADKRTPVLSRLGSQEWKSAKQDVKEAVEEVASDLLELYARRSVVVGHAFSQDTAWQQELEASFPYLETEDQLRVLAEVKRDMENSRPMDRLICGDVGYGKTEVALRAAFKAVLDGKQVAVLVPTTVLAQQHYETFSERLAAFPAQVEMLSRFRTPQQQKEILEQLQKGQVDIVIGTHRLLSGDVKFKDLGLLVIDEEQRFGVTHKESLKKIRTEIDVLTMTATPIPRTLYMTLTGARDISTINTPPEERLPIITHVGPFSPKIVRQAILRELERGGQVFFVHNRVQTINAMCRHLEQLIPEARIVIAHGQMSEQLLAERMHQFTSGQVDLLLCTTIIESGLDIPNANTLIVDRADTFGLAQLYQLRGRVGRGAQRAYAYFFRHTKKLPSLEGRQRLDTIAENTQLGAGFSIAMRDLEIRGTGDILGTRQHGHIASVGFHLYTRLLAEAIRRLLPKTGDKHPSQPLSDLHIPPATPINVDLPFQTGIPSEYVSDKIMRLHLYRRIADLQNLRELDAITEEFSDRFGPPPESVENLLFQLKVRLLAEKAGLVAVTSDNGQLVLRYPESNIPPGLTDVSPWARVGKTALWMPYQQLGDWRQSLLEVLDHLAQFAARALAKAPTAV